MEDIDNLRKYYQDVSEINIVIPYNDFEYNIDLLANNSSKYTTLNIGNMVFRSYTISKSNYQNIRENFNSSTQEILLDKENESFWEQQLQDAYKKQKIATHKGGKSKLKKKEPALKKTKKRTIMIDNI